MREFAKYGPIASVKIMWPREDELIHARALSGFVAFMTRSSAEQAKEEMDGKVLGGTRTTRGVGETRAPPGQTDLALDRRGARLGRVRPRTALVRARLLDEERQGSRGASAGAAASEGDAGDDRDVPGG